MPFDEEYFDSNEFHELLQSYEAAIASGQEPFMDADDLVDIADYYNWMGDTDKADHAADHAHELYPHATLPNVFKARQALAVGDIAEAEAFADLIDEHDDPEYHYLRAEILVVQDRIDEADDYLREYAKTVTPSEYGDFVKDCANLYIDYGVSDKAYEWMMRSKGDNSDDFKELMARTLFGLGKYKDSERLFNELIDNNPYSKQYWNALASAQFMSEDYSGAVTSSEYAIAIDPNDPESLLNKANGLFRLGNYAEALKYYQRYAETEGADDFSMLHQGVCLGNLNRIDEAIDVLQQAVGLCSKESALLPQVYQELAFCYSHKKRPDLALMMLDKTDTLDCDHIEMMVIRGHVLLENARIPEAEEAFKLAIYHSDSSPSVLLRIIVSLYDNHYINACYQMFKKFFRIMSISDKDYHGGYAYMALCCYDLQKTDEFLHYLSLATAHTPQEARMVLGFLFPEDMEPADYYEYIKKRLTP